MTNQTDTPAGPTAQKQALLEAFDTVLKQQAEAREAELREAEARRRARRRVRPWISASAVLALILCSYLYVERPEWLFPTAGRFPSRWPSRRPSLRIGMANVAQHLERYRQRTGAMPRTLAESGTRVEGDDLRAARVRHLAAGRHQRRDRAHAHLAGLPARLPRQQLRSHRSEGTMKPADAGGSPSSSC